MLSTSRFLEKIYFHNIFNIEKLNHQSTEDQYLLNLLLITEKSEILSSNILTLD